MSHQVSPFAAMTGVEKQLKWLEYQSIQLPYVEAAMDPQPTSQEEKKEEASDKIEQPIAVDPATERPQPPPEVPRVMLDYQKTRHSQYDAVIARMKQAALQSQRSQALQLTQQGH